MRCIEFQDGYKYQLKEAFSLQTSIRPRKEVSETFLKLSLDGLLEIEEGYAWDGPSGPTYDTSNFMRGSLVHDALYQLMREGHLDRKVWREPADRLLQAICRKDGMSAVRAWWVYQAVRRFGDPAADPKNSHPPRHAPEPCAKPSE